MSRYRANSRDIHHKLRARNYTHGMSTQHSDRSPGRPTEYADRVTKVVRFEHELNDRIKEAAASRGVSVNLMITWAVREYLDRLPPVEVVLKSAS